MKQRRNTTTVGRAAGTSTYLNRYAPPHIVPKTLTYTNGFGMLTTIVSVPKRKVRGNAAGFLGPSAGLSSAAAVVVITAGRFGVAAARAKKNPIRRRPFKSRDDTAEIAARPVHFFEAVRGV